MYHTSPCGTCSISDPPRICVGWWGEPCLGCSAEKEKENICDLKFICTERFYDKTAFDIDGPTVHDFFKREMDIVDGFAYAKAIYLLHSNEEWVFSRGGILIRETSQK